MATLERQEKQKRKKEERKLHHEFFKLSMRELRKQTADTGLNRFTRNMNTAIIRREARNVILARRGNEAQAIQQQEIERKADQLALQQITRQDELISPEQLLSLIDTDSAG